MKFFTILFLTCYAAIFAQGFYITGRVIDSSTSQALFGANIFLKELNTGITTDTRGEFTFSNLPAGGIHLEISYLGYEKKEYTFQLDADKEFEFKLKPTILIMEETIVKGNRATFRETPVAFNEIDFKEMDIKLGSRDVIYALQSSPSTLVSAQGGGFGDLRLNLRGFDQTNIAVMVNGIPVNNPENGEVYWSNWAGISDVVDYLQVQRGLGATPYSTPSVGGSVNIVTKASSNFLQRTRLRSEAGSNNFRKLTASYSTEIIPGKLGISMLLSRKTWDGYADETWFNEITYYLSIGGSFGNHSLEIQAIGSPQKHGQRTSAQTISTWEKRGLNYNPDFGYLNGTPLNFRDNRYHKPSINLNHNWEISNNLILSNILYYTYGNGGGIVPIGSFQTDNNGWIDYDSVYDFNSSNVDSNYHPSLKRSNNILSLYHHVHDWFGLISNLRYDAGDFIYSFGIDAKYYSSKNYQTIDNLLGGDYYIGSGDLNQDPTTLLNPGDKIIFYAESFVKQFGSFFQTEFNDKNFSSYLNLSISSTGYNRLDHFNYLSSDPQRETGWTNLFGFTSKAGLNFNIDSNNNIYLNAGYFSKAPLSMHVYNFMNYKYDNLRNEKITSIELGYGFKDDNTLVKVNSYLTFWKDKSISQTVQDTKTNQYFFYNIIGAGARHMGIEIEGNLKIIENLELKSMLSVSENKWLGNVNAVIAPESDPTQQTNIYSYVDNIYVGNFPMTTASFSLNYIIAVDHSSKFYLIPEYNFAGRQYANYNADTRTNIGDSGLNSWRLPDFFTSDLHAGFEKSISNFFIKGFEISFHIFNLSDRKYIADASDGIDHSALTSRVWYGRERWWHVSLILDF